MSDINNTKKPDTLLDILIGVTISVIAYLIVWFVSFGRIHITYFALIDFLVVAIAVFLIVKFYRIEHRAAATTMLVLMSPIVLVMLIMGSCGLLILPH